MKNSTLGTAALIGAPCLFLSFQFPASGTDAIGNSETSNAFGLVYLLGWMCSIYALYRLQATGHNLIGRAILPLLLLTLTIASVSNIYAMISPNSQSTFYFYIDLFWPISNCLMFLTGITVVVANKLKGWRRFVPLAVGLWFPLLIICLTVYGKTSVTATVLGLYSAFAWSAMALMVMETKYKPQKLIYSATKQLPLQQAF